jgi:hypothetical protein
MFTSMRLMSAALFIPALLTQPAFAALHRSPFTIEEVMQAPYPSSLVAGPLRESGPRPTACTRERGPARRGRSIGIGEVGGVNE